MPIHETDELGFEAPLPVGHPTRAGLPANHSGGPAVGTKLPDIVLPDHRGRRVNLHEDRARAKVAVCFIRSAVW